MIVACSAATPLLQQLVQTLVHTLAQTPIRYGFQHLQWLQPKEHVLVLQVIVAHSCQHSVCHLACHLAYSALFICCRYQSCHITYQHDFLHLNSTMSQLVINPKTLSGRFCSCSGRRCLLHLEATNLLLVLSSTQLYTTAAASPAGTHPFIDSIMQQTQLAPQLVQQSLQHFITRPPLPPGTQLWSPSQDAGNGVLHLVRTAAGIYMAVE